MALSRTAQRWRLDRETRIETGPRTEPGDRIYAIGDIHGRHDLLRQLLDEIGEHSSMLPKPGALHLVFLGDLVDRGPDSAKVVEMVCDLETNTNQVIALMGNHEEAMIQALEGDVTVLRKWLEVGGAQTVESYGLDLPDAGADLRRYARYLAGGVPAQHLRWLRDRPLSARSGNYFFCHAGIRPGVPLGRQTRDDLLWIRDDFVDDESDHGAVIVHGHTITRDVVMRANRIGIDTGAYASGALSALYLEGDRQAILTTRASS
jgi:serine/threonine protein phosphatase 1